MSDVLLLIAVNRRATGDTMKQSVNMKELGKICLLSACLAMERL